jgi:hypothetical protein
MLKDTLLHMLFMGAVVFAASFLKKDVTTKVPDTVAQRYETVTDYDHYPYNADVAPVVDTLKRK